MNKASKGLIYLNSYGYKSCVITIWEKEEAERIVDKLTNIRGDPHKKAMDYVHRGKIKKILDIAWQPKRKIRSIEDLLASVEELNPQNKVHNAKYRYPFSTVLVEWTDGLERTWISQTNYKTLSSQLKALNERIDRKFYQTGLIQVKRFQEYQQVDSRNLGDLESTPPGLSESPEPGESNAIRGNTASHPANNKNGVSQIGSNQSSSSQNPSSQNAGS